jgi:hypothetical protein
MAAAGAEAALAGAAPEVLNKQANLTAVLFGRLEAHYS